MVGLVSVYLTTPSCEAYTFQVKGEWEEYKGEHFLIYYHPKIPKSYVNQFYKKCEKYYVLITERLGFNRFDFWLWEDRAKIYMYETKQAYIRATGRPGWSGAAVHIKKKYINTYFFQRDIFDTMLPHELTHIILREFIGQKANAPLWFDEGVASANEENAYLRHFLIAKGFIERDFYLKISEMNKMTPYNMRTPTLFYASAGSLIIFFMENYKKDKFSDFCKELRDGTAFHLALLNIYGIENSGDLEAKFLKFMRQTSYEDVVSRENGSVEW